MFGTEELESCGEYMNPGLVMALRRIGFSGFGVATKGKGSHVYFSDYLDYPVLDCQGSSGITLFGHNHPTLVQGMSNFLQDDQIVFLAGHPMPHAVRLAKRLARLTGLQHTFFAPSGTEAVEAAIKLVCAATGRSGLVAFRNGFHGKTLGALAVTGVAKYRTPFESLLPKVHFISEYGTAHALTETEDVFKHHRPAACFVESIQGERGVLLSENAFLKGLRELCTRYDVLLVIDEIQTGLGRTGKMFGYEHAGIVPDICLLAKALGGGMVSIGACISRDGLWQAAYGRVEGDVMPDATVHSSTFGGNNLATYIAGLVLDLLEGGLMDQIMEKGARLQRGLRGVLEKHPHILREVRGQGLMAGLELQDVGQQLVGPLVAGELFREHRILTGYNYNLPHVIRFAPAVVISDEDIDTISRDLGILLSGPGFSESSLQAMRS